MAKENYGDTVQDDRHQAKDRTKKIWCYMRKGWTAYVRGAKKYAKKYEDIKWDKSKKENEKIVQEGAITKHIYKF
ncbi:MAG: hypothetical protein ACYTEO_14175 [Planctomycetota bacterium]|jgi:hypothetical protein